jgi:hypothetical protein
MSSSPTPEGPGSVSGAPNLPDGFADTFTSRYVDTGELRLHAVTGGDGPPLLLVGHSYGGAVITQRRRHRHQRRWPGLRRRLRPRRTRTPRRRRGQLHRQHPQHGPGPAPISDRPGRRDGGGVRYQPRPVPRGVRRRPAHRADRRDGRHPAAGCRLGLHRCVRPAGLEDAPVLGGRRHRGTGPPAATSSGPWPSGPQRAGADIVEVEGSHVIMISQPQAVADVILQAVHAVS